MCAGCKQARRDITALLAALEGDFSLAQRRSNLDYLDGTEDREILCALIAVRAARMVSFHNPAMPEFLALNHWSSVALEAALENGLAAIFDVTSLYEQMAEHIRQIARDN